MKQASKAPATITITYLDASEDDCRRIDYVTYVDGKEFLLAACALGTQFTTDLVTKKAKELFGEDIIIKW